MKVKTLLLAAAAFVAFGAAAQATVTTPDLTINKDNVNTVIEMPLTLNMPEGDDFCNIEFHVQFPKGIKPAKSEDFDVFVDVGADIPANKKGIPYLSYTDNAFPESMGGEYNEAAWPLFKVVGANMQKVAATANPAEFALMYVTADESVEKSSTFGIYLKYTKSDDGFAEIGENPADGDEVFETLCQVTSELKTAVNDVNAVKTVSSVKYINAAGMTSDTAFDGINIVVTKYADGSQSVAKVVK